MPRSFDQTSDPSPDSGVLARHGPGRGIEFVASARLQRVQLDVVTQGEDRWERIGELDDGRGRDDRHEAEIVGNRGRDDIRNRPPEWHDDRPQDFASPVRQRRRFQNIPGKSQRKIQSESERAIAMEIGNSHEHIIVENLDPNIAIQPCCDQPAHACEHISYDLEPIQ